jgi:hypothetical protein
MPLCGDGYATLGRYHYDEKTNASSRTNTTRLRNIAQPILLARLTLRVPSSANRSRDSVDDDAEAEQEYTVAENVNNDDFHRASISVELEPFVNPKRASTVLSQENLLTGYAVSDG